MKIKLELKAVEISKILALAIGWTEDGLDEDGVADPDLIIEGPFCGHDERVMVWFCGAWREFNYQDPSITNALIEKFGLKIKKLRRGGWRVKTPCGLKGRAKTIEGAVAMTIISLIFGPHLNG